MPWTPAQHRLFEAAAHNPQIAAAHGIPQYKAASMAGEGIKGANTGFAPMTSRTAPASTTIHGMTGLRRSPMMEEARRFALVKALKGG